MLIQKPASKNNFLTKFIVILVILLSFVQIIAANIGASSGAEVEDIDNKIEQIKKENQRLELEIARLISLSQLEKKAKKMGFKKAGSFIFLSKPLPFAYNLPK